MLFWLTLIQSLPTLPDLTLDEDGEVMALEPTAAIAEMPLTPAPVVGQLGGLGVLVSGGVVMFIVLLLLAIVAYTRVYVITPTNEAFVKTGGVVRKQKKVVLNGGCVVLPGFHELTRVPLRELSIDVERTGKLAVRTQDYLRADMRVTFYVCINASEDDVLTAAARLSREGQITPEDIKNALEKRADDGIRAAAKTKTLAEIDSDKLGFAQEVLNLIEPDLKKVGLTLNNLAISEIEESDTYDTNNFFDAQGVRLRTETIQWSIQQKREVELATRVAIEQKELDAEKRSLEIARDQEDAKQAQILELESLKAEREREIQEKRDREAATAQRTKILQEQSVEEEEIQRQLSVRQKQIDADIELEERQKTLKIAQARQREESDVAEVNRQKAVDSAQYLALVDIAEAERASKVAQQEAAIAIAEQERSRFMAEAERAQAEASVETATFVEQAEREQRLSLIAAEREAQERRIADQNVVEIDVFRKRRQAEIAKQTAELEAEAIRTLAQAELDQALAQAQGQQANIEARNAISSANLTADVIAQMWPQLAERLPEVLSALAPQPGVIGDARIYAFPGMNGDGNGTTPGDINKLLLSTSGLSLINSLLDEGKLGTVLSQVKDLLQGEAATGAEPTTEIAPPADPPPSVDNNDD
ncbi:flotillin family protein [Halomicronema sp. CCY15110]|uniref:flotillin family protein n=1 Tax=Halomicronema sp. CCY15110 TaxID=2767773 RepID=UPI001950E713|nr:SPFH domain-containing protein [Halomicronema sp. CCY15110]